MTTDATIRPFEVADTEAVVSLWETALPSAQPWNDGRNVLIRKQLQCDDLIFVAVLEGVVVGAVTAGYDGIRGWIYHLAVSSEFRRRGIGRRLIEYAENALRAMGCPKVNLQVRSDNSVVLAFYERCGYAVEERASLGKPLASRVGATVDPVPVLEVTDAIRLAPITFRDKDAYLKHLNETEDFQNNGVQTPFPYTELDAERWLAFVAAESLARDCRRSWAIRDCDGQAIGGLGLNDIKVGDTAHVGYWLAKSFWGRGIMTQVVRRLCSFAFEQYELRRLQARVYSINPASARVLTKVGFEHEGTLRRHFIRNGEAIDDLIFGLLREEWKG